MATPSGHDHSPWMRRWHQNAFSRASRSTTDRTLRCVAGRPDLPRRARWRRTMSRYQRKMVPGVTISRIATGQGTRQAASQSAGPARPGLATSGVYTLAAAHAGDSELMAQHQDLSVLPPPLPARQPEQRHCTAHATKSSFKPTSPRSAHSGPRPARPPADRGTESIAIGRASCQAAQVFGTHRIRRCSPAPPYTSSPATQRAAAPAVTARRSSSPASWGLVANMTSSGTPASSRCSSSAAHACSGRSAGSRQTHPVAAPRYR
jgi:hypothetical protein